MYHTILLAYDGTRECQIALREGTDLALIYSASVVLLSVMPLSLGVAMGEGFNAGDIVRADHEHYQTILHEGVSRLHEWGLNAHGRLVLGDPVTQISQVAHEIEADLVVLGHSRRNAIARWWRSSTGETLLEELSCSILIAQHEEAHHSRSEPHLSDPDAL